MSIESAVAAAILVVVFILMVRYIGWFITVLMYGFTWLYEWAMDTGNEPVFSIVAVGLIAVLFTWIALEARWGVPGIDEVGAAVDPWISARLKAGVNWIRQRVR